MSSPHKNQDFIHTQREFAAAIRDPEKTSLLPGVEARRMAIYQTLFYNNIEGFIANAFPVLRAITADSDWHAMIRDFMITHRCKTPLFHEIAREFLTYLETERDLSADPIFIKELAHYEWVELALSIATETLPSQSSYSGGLDQQYQVSPLAWPLAYHYPVHLISPDYQPETASEFPICLLVYRNTDDKVTFLELNPVSFRLIKLLQSGMTALAAVATISQELQHPNPDILAEGAHTLILDWLERAILR